MAIDLSKKKSRAVFVAANKYQNDLILIAFIPSALIFLSFISIIFISNPAITKALFHISFYDNAKLVSKFSGLIIFLLCFMFMLSIIAAFFVSHNMIGAFGRIIREMDDVIAGRSQKMISSRPNDTMTKELLKRVNLLIESYVKHADKTS